MLLRHLLEAAAPSPAAANELVSTRVALLVCLRSRAGTGTSPSGCWLRRRRVVFRSSSGPCGMCIVDEGVRLLERWGDTGRSGEIWGDEVVRLLAGDMGRYGEMWGDVGRYEVVRLLAVQAAARAAPLASEWTVEVLPPALCRRAGAINGRSGSHTRAGDAAGAVQARPLARPQGEDRRCPHGGGGAHQKRIVRRQ